MRALITVMLEKFGKAGSFVSGCGYPGNMLQMFLHTCYYALRTCVVICDAHFPFADYSISFCATPSYANSPVVKYVDLGE